MVAVMEEVRKELPTLDRFHCDMSFNLYSIDVRLLLVQSNVIITRHVKMLGDVRNCAAENGGKIPAAELVSDTSVGTVLTILLLGSGLISQSAAFIYLQVVNSNSRNRCVGSSWSFKEVLIRNPLYSKVGLQVTANCERKIQSGAAEEAVA